jgi:hypothetical protein
MAADKTESQWRLAAGSMAIVGSVAEVSGAMLEKVPMSANRVAVGLRSVFKPSLLKATARWLGAAGGIIMAAWDGVKAWDEFHKDHNFVAGGYAASSILGIIITYGFWASWNPVALVILVAIFALTAWLLEKYKDNKLQSWLEQCVFGNGDHYKTAQMEQQEFALAVK